ncbi:MAG: hypothetical protein JXB00_17550 [Bacteroidales bacterium]|nr:hypothetical protein [Bacteroidales bacterium]
MKSNWKFVLFASATMIAILLMNKACDEYDDNEEETYTHGVPVLLTSDVTDITQSSAISGGNITSDSGSAITGRGVCWGEHQNPITGDHATNNGSGIGEFVSNISELAPNTTYYVRAYATNSDGTAYGDQVEFKTLAEEKIQYTLTLEANPGNAGTVNGAGKYEAGETIFLTAVPDNNFIFLNWTKEGVIVSNTPDYNYTMPASDVMLTANFEEKPACENCVTDNDGNVYHSITIGTQTWLIENLRTTRFNDGTAIPVQGFTIPGYSWYDNNSSTYAQTYGALYNWPVLDQASNGGKNVCPSGWHVPTKGEWTTLTDFLGGEGKAGAKLKEAGTNHWKSPNLEATNETGFTALPGGYRYKGMGDFYFIGESGFWWSSSEKDASIAWLIIMGYNGSKAIIEYTYKTYGFSIRCLKD